MNAALFDYGVGNIHSLGKGLEGAGATVTVTSDWQVALGLDALVLPGVGAFGAASQAVAPARHRVRDALVGGLPCLGICLGMQLLFDGSEESTGEGLGLLKGPVRRIRAKTVPQMGWNDVDVSCDPLFEGVTPLVAYYANSYVCEPVDTTTIIAWSGYEGIRFPAAVRAGHTWGVQFHPEKSSDAGRRVLANWVRLAGGAK